MSELEKLIQARDTLNEVIAGRQSSGTITNGAGLYSTDGQLLHLSPSGNLAIGSPAQPAKSQPQSPPASKNKVSDGLDKKKILGLLVSAEQEANELRVKGANVDALLARLGDIADALPGKRKTASDAITRALGEAQALRDDGGFDTSALMAQLNLINESIGSGGATIGGTDVTGDMES